MRLEVFCGGPWLDRPACLRMFMATPEWLWLMAFDFIGQNMPARNQLVIQRPRLWTSRFCEGLSFARGHTAAFYALRFAEL
jgi:hypothetical protein